MNPGAVDLSADDHTNVPDNRRKKKNPLGKDYSFDHLGENEAMFEKNKDKNFDGKRIRGLKPNKGFVDMGVSMWRIM